MATGELFTLKRDCEVIEIPSGARMNLAAGSSVRILQSLGGSYTVSSNSGARYRIDSRDAGALGLPETTADQSPASAPLSERLVLDQLRAVFDPEIPVNIVDLGLVYGCSILPTRESVGNLVEVKMTMTAPGCGMGDVLKSDVERRLSRLPGVTEVRVEIVFDPPWHPGRMSDAAKLQLGLDDAPPSPFPVLS